ncbi:MAG: CopG family ribbon-helix-helix protein [Spirochaetota bacterium]
MAVATVNIAFEKNLLKAIDGVAKKEHRSRSELVREAVRGYIEQKERWQQLFSAYDSSNATNLLTEQEVIAEIAAYRKEKASRK